MAGELVNCVSQSSRLWEFRLVAYGDLNTKLQKWRETGQLLILSDLLRVFETGATICPPIPSNPVVQTKSLRFAPNCTVLNGRPRQTRVECEYSVSV